MERNVTKSADQKAWFVCNTDAEEGSRLPARLHRVVACHTDSKLLIIDKPAAKIQQILPLLLDQFGRSFDLVKNDDVQILTRRLAPTQTSQINIFSSLRLPLLRPAVVVCSSHALPKRLVAAIDSWERHGFGQENHEPHRRFPAPPPSRAINFKVRAREASPPVGLGCGCRYW